MRKALVGLVAAGTLALAPSTALASGPAQHFTEDVKGAQFFCGTRTYTVTSGSLKTTIHEGESKSGNTNITGTFTLNNVVATSGDKTYQLRGAVWFGATTNAKQGSEQFTFTGKIQIVARGTGKVDNVNQTFHLTLVNGDVKTAEVDMGTCQLPD